MDERKDAPAFDLSASVSEDEDALLVEPADLIAPAQKSSEKKKPEENPQLNPPVKPVSAIVSPNPTLDAQMFNALVSPAAPPRLTESFVSDSNRDPDVKQREVAGLGDADSAAVPATQVEAPSPGRVWDPAAIEDESLDVMPPVVSDHVVVETTPSQTTLDEDDFPVAEPFFATHVTQDQESHPIETHVNFALATPVVESSVPAGRTGAWWTLPLMCVGIAMTACAVLVPATDENRQAMHELAKIERDVDYFERQSDVNKQFLEHVSTDPTLAERLALRQLRLTRVASKIVPMPKTDDAFGMSPYALVSIDPPVPMPAYRPLGGFISTYFLDSKGQIYLAGLGILLTAAGVILGGGAPRSSE